MLAALPDPPSHHTSSDLTFLSKMLNSPSTVMVVPAAFMYTENIISFAALIALLAFFYFAIMCTMHYGGVRRVGDAKA